MSLEVLIHSYSLTCSMHFRHFENQFDQNGHFVYRSQRGKASYSAAHQPRSSLAPDYWHPSCSAPHRWSHRALAVPQPSTPKCLSSQTDGVSRPPYSRQRTQHPQQHHAWSPQPKTNGPSSPQWSTKDLHQGLHRHAHPHTLPRTHGGESAPAFSLPVLVNRLPTALSIDSCCCLSSNKQRAITWGPQTLE